MKKDKPEKQDKREKKAAYIFTPPRITKTHHRTGYHKPIKNPTTNAAPDTHKAFCKRCFWQYNHGICPMTGTAFKSKTCSV